MLSYCVRNGKVKAPPPHCAKSAGTSTKAGSPTRVRLDQSRPEYVQILIGGPTPIFENEQVFMAVLMLMPVREVKW